MCWELIAIFIFFKIRMRVDIFGTQKCKVTFGFEYILLIKMLINEIALRHCKIYKRQVSVQMKTVK